MQIILCKVFFVQKELFGDVERVPTKIEHCAGNFQILKIAETLAISSPH